MLIVVVLLAAGAIAVGVALGVYMLRTRSHDRASVPATAELDQRFRASRARFDLLFAACDGLPARLNDLADAAAAHAGVLRELADADLRLIPAQLESDWEPPWDLRRDTPRMPVAAWQRLDRALEQLAAVIDAPGGAPAAHAAVYDELALAARSVADQLDAAARSEDGPFNSATTVCGYCNKPAAKARRVIAGPLLAICDECVAACVEILEDQLGDDWRTRPA
jgi:hypothetical protein